MGYKYKSQFCFYINWCFWKSEKNENKIFIFEALNLDVFLDRNKAYMYKKKEKNDRMKF